MPLEHTDYKDSPGKISNMSLSNSINGFTWNLICLFLNILMPFFFKITFYIEVNYNGEYLLFIHYLILLSPSQGPTG